MHCINLISTSFCQSWHTNGFLFLDDCLSFQSENLRNVKEGEAGSLPKLAGSESLNLKVRRGFTVSSGQSCCEVWISIYDVLMSGHQMLLKYDGLSLGRAGSRFDWNSSSWSLYLRYKSTPIETQNNWIFGPHRYSSDLVFYDVSPTWTVFF